MAEAFLAWYKPVEGVEAQFEVWPSRRFPHHGRNHSGVVGYVPFAHPSVLITALCRIWPLLESFSQVFISLHQSSY